MALYSTLKLFEAGKEVYYAVKTDKGYCPRPMTVMTIKRGRVELKHADGGWEECSLQTRKLCFTFEECQYICNRMNEV